MTEPRAAPQPDSISRMFGAIADHYDLMNFVMTLGQDQRWRRQAAGVSGLRPGGVALDVATGTGDMAFALSALVQPGGRVIGLDFSEPMLQIARRKARRRELPVTFLAGDALKLGFEDDSFDAVACAFGIRNFEDRVAALKQMARVTRPGGRVVILELTPPSNALARRYMDDVIPRLGQVLAGARDAYTYLPESVQTFPDARTLGAMMHEAGLRQVTFRLMNFGTVALHWATWRG